MSELTLLEPNMWLLTSAVALVGGFVRGFSGIGGPAVMSLVLTVFYSPISVLPKVLLIDQVAQLKLLPNAYPDVDWKVCLTVVGSSLLGIPLGVYLLVEIDPVSIRRAIAMVVAGCTFAMLLGWRFKSSPGLAIQVAVGFVAGVVMGGTYIALVAAIFFFAAPIRAAVARADMIYWSSIIGLILVGVFSVTGHITLDEVWRSLLIGVVYLIGAILGSRVFLMAGERDFRRAVMWLLVVLSAGVMLA